MHTDRYELVRLLAVQEFLRWCVVSFNAIHLLYRNYVMHQRVEFCVWNAPWLANMWPWYQNVFQGVLPQPLPGGGDLIREMMREERKAAFRLSAGWLYKLLKLSRLPEHYNMYSTLDVEVAGDMQNSASRLYRLTGRAGRSICKHSTADCKSRFNVSTL